MKSKAQHRAAIGGWVLVSVAACSSATRVGENIPCEAGLEACPSSSGRPVCVALESDPIHCGACGRGCPRGVCAGGVCCEGSACAGRCQASQFEVQSATVGVETVAIAVADFDRDGLDDLFVATNGESRVLFFWGRRDGALVEGETYRWGKPGYWIGAGDLDNDGNLDALLLPDDDVTGAHLGMRVRFGDGRRGFDRDRWFETTGYNPVAGWVADVDHDGLNDALLLAPTQRCLLLLRGLGEGALSEARCVRRIEDATDYGPSLTRLGDDAQGRSVWLSEGRSATGGYRPVERWTFAPDGASVERVDPIAGLSAEFNYRSALTRGAAGRPLLVRFGVPHTATSPLASPHAVDASLTLSGCDAPPLLAQRDAAGGEAILSAGDFDGDGRVDYFGLTSFCTGCPGTLFAHLAR